MTEKKKEFTFPFICILLGIVVAETFFKGTPILGIIVVVGGLFFIPYWTIWSIKCLGKKEWGGAAVGAAIAVTMAYAVWIRLSHFSWRQLPEEIDKILDILMKIFK
jgi:hypothetical protein